MGGWGLVGASNCKAPTEHTGPGPSATPPQQSPSTGTLPLPAMPARQRDARAQESSQRAFTESRSSVRQHGRTGSVPCSKKSSSVLAAGWNEGVGESSPPVIYSSCVSAFDRSQGIKNIIELFPPYLFKKTNPHQDMQRFKESWALCVGEGRKALLQLTPIPSAEGFLPAPAPGSDPCPPPPAQHNELENTLPQTGSRDSAAFLWLLLRRSETEGLEKTQGK